MIQIISMIVLIVVSLIILTTRYETNSLIIQTELDRCKMMFLKIDGSVDSYLDSGENLANINFQVLNTGHYLLSNSIISGSAFGSTMKFNQNQIVWHLIPNMGDITSYKLMIDFSSNGTLMEKVTFSEMFIGTHLCEKLLFGDFYPTINSYDELNVNFIDLGGSNTDGIIECTIYK